MIWCWKSCVVCLSEQLCICTIFFGPLTILPIGLSRHGMDEAYLLCAFLSFNDGFQVLFWVPFAAIAWRKMLDYPSTPAHQFGFAEYDEARLIFGKDNMT